MGEHGRLLYAVFYSLKEDAKSFARKKLQKRSLYEEEKSFCCSTVLTHALLISCFKLGETAKYGSGITMQVNGTSEKMKKSC